MSFSKIFSVGFVALILLAIIATWLVFGSNTNFTENKKSFYITTGSKYQTVLSNLESEGIIKNKLIFGSMAGIVGYDDKTVKAGKFIIEKNESIATILRKLKSGRQTPVKLVINKLRTKENFAQKIAANFECDSITIMSLLNNNNFLDELNLDSNTAMVLVIPNTYSILWNTPGKKILKKLFTEQEVFWTTERKTKANAHNLSPAQVYILASIVEEETNMESDKGKIASVYLNRIETGMRLGADPTVKFAMKDFTLKRIYQKHLSFPSLYNTYLHSGLPPGPICTPSQKTIDAVLNAPATTYLYFVAKPDLNGYSNFSTTYPEHLQFAKAYQRALDSMMKKKEAAFKIE
jgi:UPF0755 protein